MADEDKLINVVVKYSTEGSDTVAAAAAKSREQLDMFGKDFAAFNDKYMTAGTTNDEVFTPPFVKGREQLDMFGKDIAAFKEKYMTAGAEVATPIVSPEATGASLDGIKQVVSAEKEQYAAEQEARYSGLDWNKESVAYREEEAAGTQKMTQELTTFNGKQQNTTKEFRSMRMASRELMQVGMFATMAGGLLTGAIVADANNYVKTMGQINSTSREWLGYQESIKKSNLEIGKVAADAMLPAMKSAAEFMKDISNVLAQNPWMVQAALYVGGALTAVGMAITVMAQIERVVAVFGLQMARLEQAQVKQAALMEEQAAMKPLNAGGGLPGGAGSRMASEVGALSGIQMVSLTAGSIICGAEVGLLIGNALGKLIYGDDYKKQTMGDAFMTWFKLFEIPGMAMVQLINKINPHFADFGNGLLGAIGKLNQMVGSVVGDTASKTAAAAKADTSDLNAQELARFISFQKQMVTAQENYSSQRADTIAQYEKQVADVTAQYESQRADTIANFEQQLARQAEAFAIAQANALSTYNDAAAKEQSSANEASSKARASFQLSEQRAAQAHALDMQRLAEQHNNKMGDLAAARDALGIVKENQSYALEVSQKNQDYAIAQSQRRADFQIQEAERKAQEAKKLAELKTAFEKQQALAKAAEELKVAQQTADEVARLAKMDSAHKAELAKMDVQEKDKLAKLEAAYKKEIDLMNRTLIDSINVMDKTLLGMTDALAKEGERQLADFQAWIASNKAGNTVAAGVATGTGSGASAKSISASASSGSANMLASLLSSKSGGSAGQQTLNVTVQSRNLTMSEIKTQISTALNQTLGELMPAFGA